MALSERPESNPERTATDDEQLTGKLAPVTRTLEGSRRGTDPHTVLRVVAAVALSASREDPAGVSMRAFNAARVGSPHPDAPTAEAVHQRFNRHGARVSWREILRVACTIEDPTQWIARRETPVREHIVDEDCYYALRTVCRELEGVSFPPDRYTATRDRLLDRDRHRPSGGLLDELLPTANQILQQFDGDWTQALASAGLPAHERPTRTTRETIVSDRSLRSIGIVEAIEQFALANDRFPGKDLLRRFCSEWDVRLADPEPGIRHAVYLARAEALWRGRGETPPRRPHRNDGKEPICLPDTRPDGLAPYGPQQAVWTQALIVEKLAEYTQELGSRRGSQRDYRQRIEKNCDCGWPAPSIITRYGLHFQEALAQARRQPDLNS